MTLTASVTDCYMNTIISTWLGIGHICNYILDQSESLYGSTQHHVFINITTHKQTAEIQGNGSPQLLTLQLCTLKH